MLVKRRNGRTIDRAEKVGEPESGSNGDDGLVMLPECGAESARFRGGTTRQVKLTCAE